MENNQRSSSNPHLAKPMLCDGFLIPMTDFVLRINEIEKEVDQFFDSWRMKQLRIIENYAKFLKQPLKLEMFVPCVNGEPIEFHEGKVLSIAKVGSELLKEAKEKVLFELNSPVAVETMNYHISRNRNIEYLANFGSIKLTQNSLSAIFG